jgi:class 3 adenylate cyclase
MDPQIRYCKTKDGVSIAYTTYGEGSPLFWAADFPWSHLQIEARGVGAPFVRMGERMVVRYDARGLGMSDRDVEDLSIEARQLDIEAVADVLGFPSFDLLAVGLSGPTTIAFAASHPDRVARLVLVNSFAMSRRGLKGSQQAKTVSQLAPVDWEMFSENLAGLTFGWGREEARQAGEFIRATVTQEMYARLQAELMRDDVTGLLPDVKAPTLILQHAEFKPLTPESGRILATGIPNARLTVVEGSWQNGVGPIFRAAAEFLDEGTTASRTSPRAPQERGGFATILFTDVEGSTALTDHLGDKAARDVLREHEHTTREALNAHGGSEVKTMGDGFMASFGSATRAMECAIAIQRAFDHQGLGNAPGKPAVRVRIGLNAGEPIAEDDDLFGTAVIVAARIAAKAQGGEILVSDVVRQLVAGKGFLFNDRGTFPLKGFEEPVRVYEVSWRNDI